MATTTINASLQGLIERQDTGSSAINWLTTTRNAAAGSSTTTVTVNTNLVGLRAQYEVSKGTYISTCTRTFLFFDLLLPKSRFVAVRPCQPIGLACHQLL